MVRNLVGEKFGKIEVIERAGVNNRNDAMWFCHCDCGSFCRIKGWNLSSGHTKSCGCIKKGIDRTKIEGQKFHSILITNFLHSDKFRESIYEYKCDCGNSGTIRLQKIGKNKKCPECRRKTHGEISGGYWANLKHGAASRNLSFEITSEQAWNLFVEQDKKCALSGIELEISRHSKFRKNKMQTASLDRIDSKKGYTPNNIQWIHKKINALKMDMSEKELISWCEKIVNHKKGLK